MPFTAKLTLPTPKKNSRVVRGKKSCNSTDFKVWHETAMADLKAAGVPAKPFRRCLIDLEFTFPDRRRRDLTNFADSVMDALVDAGVIEDDNWEVVPNLQLRGSLGNALTQGVTIDIWEVE